jgi:hypothetical protein
MAGWLLAKMDFRGLRSHLPDEIEDQCDRHHTRRYGAYDRDRTPRDCLEARSSQLVGRQRDPSSAAGVIDYALSYGTVHVADISYDKHFYRKTVALGPIVKIARNAGATTRVQYIRILLGVGGPAHPITLMGVGVVCQKKAASLFPI